MTNDSKFGPNDSVYWYGQLRRVYAIYSNGNCGIAKTIHDINTYSIVGADELCMHKRSNFILKFPLGTEIRYNDRPCIIDCAYVKNDNYYYSLKSGNLRYEVQAEEIES
jgi:hypothetical protein